jgi:hypothetical protein
MTPHKHAELIKAWADGHKIQHWVDELSAWRNERSPAWSPYEVYRLKPEAYEYRLALMDFGELAEHKLAIVSTKKQETEIQDNAFFIKFLSPWLTYEPE